MDKFNHLYACISVWANDDKERPMTSMWDYDLVKRAFFEKESVKIGDIIKDTEGRSHKVTDVSLAILPEPNDNKYGIDFSQAGEANVNNIVVNITVKKA